MNEYEFLSISEMADKFHAGVKEKLLNPVWGEWTYDYKTRCLCFRMDGDEDDYHINLSEIKVSSQILDWIFQLHCKIWMTDEAMRDLLEALRFLLNPQANYCSCGAELACDANTLLPKKPETNL